MDSTGKQDTKRVKELQLIYEDMAGRFVNDNNNSWQIVSLSAFLLTLLGTLLVQNNPLELPVKIFSILAGIFLGLAILAGFISLLSYRDIKLVPLKTIVLGCKGAHSYKTSWDLILSGPKSLFHNTDIMMRGITLEARTAYLKEVGDRFEEDMVDYLFFLAYLIEIKKRPRALSLLFISLGGLSIAGLLFAQLL